MRKARFLVIFFVLLSLSCLPKEKSSAKPKNLILMIGDGMGPQQVSMLYYYAKYAEGVVSPEDFAFEKIAKMGEVALSATEPHGAIVVDSACSATQLSTGASSRNGMVGIDYRGDKVETIVEKAQKKGMATGLVSDTVMTHATPAAFASHVVTRRDNSGIAEGLIANNVDVLFSGGVNAFIPQGKTVKLSERRQATSSRKDSKNLLQQAKNQGYQVIHNRKDLDRVSGKVLGLFNRKAIPDAIWQSKNEKNKEREIPNLLEMSKAAIENLSKREKGFFLMIEGGQIDWAAHANDAGTMLHEMIWFNKTLNWVLNWVEKNPDTLLVVTADHETGGFGFGYGIKGIPGPVDLKRGFFKERPYQATFNFGGYENLKKMYAQKKSFQSILEDFKKLPAAEKNAASLQRIFNEAVPFKLTLAGAKRVLRDVENELYQPKTQSEKFKRFPDVPRPKAFYYDHTYARMSLMAKEIGGEQGVVWATGTHTATPVNVFSYGPGSESFQGYLNHRVVGQKLQKVLGL